MSRVSPSEFPGFELGPSGKLTGTNEVVETVVVVNNGGTIALSSSVTTGSGL